jgi:serine/threonine protein kinase/Tol biopolymer transport system component
MQILAGSVFAGYRLVRLLGRGGMGAVWEATDERLERRVALKFLSPELAQDARFRRRFLAESRLAASLDHPNIVPVYEAGEADGELFIAMRFIDGPTLEQVIASEGGLQPSRAIRLLSGVADALDVAHDLGLVHRDVKPGNIMVARTPAGEHAYLSDFGLSKRLGSDESLTRTGQVVGSVGYIAPEQIEGRPIDGRADVYSLACVLYAALAGRPPFERESDLAVLWAHVQGEPPRLGAVRPELSVLDPVLARGLAKEPDERQATAGQLMREVVEVVENPDTIGTSTASTRPDSISRSARGDPALGRRLGPQRLVVGGLIAAGLVGAAILAFGALGRAGSAPGVGPSLEGSPGSSGAATAAIAVATQDRIAWSVEDIGSNGEPACGLESSQTYALESRLWMADPTGAQPVELLPTSDVWQRQPTWAPDGTSLVFVAGEQTSERTLWSLSADGRHAKRLTPSDTVGGAMSDSPAWSGKTGRIVFLDGGAITTVKADGSDPIEVRRPVSLKDQTPETAPNEAFSATTWTPDGRIAFVRREVPIDGSAPGFGQLMAIDADGSKYGPSVTILGFDVDSGVWSPDGSEVAIVARHPGGLRQIWLINADGSGLRQLSNAGESIAPSWSPDGTRLAFASNRDGPFEIYVIGRDGAGLQRLTTSPPAVANCWPAWGRLGDGIVAPTPSAVPSPGAVLAFHRGHLQAGTYHDDVFNPSFSVTLPTGWEGHQHSVDAISLGRSDSPRSELSLLAVQAVSKTGCVMDDFVPVGERPRDLIDFLRGLKILKTSAFNTVTIAGHAASRSLSRFGNCRSAIFLACRYSDWAEDPSRSARGTRSRSWRLTSMGPRRPSSRKDRPTTHLQPRSTRSSRTSSSSPNAAVRASPGGRAEWEDPSDERIWVVT